VGLSKALNIRSRVDFPEPKGPKIDKNDPDEMVKETCFKMGTLWAEQLTPFRSNKGDGNMVKNTAYRGNMKAE